MKKAFLLGGITVGLLTLAVATVATQTAQAASNKYNFIARGVITDVDEGNKTFKMDVTKVDGKQTAKDDLQGKNVEFTVSNSTVVFKVMSNKDKRVTYHNLAIGQEVGVKGTAKEDDTNVLSFIRIHDRSFNVIGLLKEHDESAKTIKILVRSSSYKPTVYKNGTEITMTYTDDSTFRNNSGEVVFDEVDANDQRVKVSGTIINGSTWQVKTLWDNYKGK